MEIKVAFIEVFGEPVAVVLVAATVVGDVSAAREACERLRQAPELKGRRVVLAARESELSGFDYFSDAVSIVERLRQMGSLRIPFQTVQASVPTF